MARKAAGLTAVKVKSAPPGRYGDGNGLYLLVKSAETRFWVFRYTMAGRMREMGLGRAGADSAAVTLADARVAAATLLKTVRAGVDPLDQRKEAEAAKVAAGLVAAIEAITFRTVAGHFLAAHEKSWRNPKHRAQWTSTLEAYVYPHFGDLPVAKVDTSHVLAALEPIWRTKVETAARVRGRVENILDYARSRHWRTAENPARWRGHLSILLPARNKIAPVEHHAALPWPETNAFLEALKLQKGMAAIALNFAILTAARTSETLGARWSEVDLAARIWTIPAARMKAGREHRVPLSKSALALLKDLASIRVSDDGTAHVFPGASAAHPLSNMAMAMVLRRMKRDDLTVHGFRSTFRDWVGEATSARREVAEAALAHVVGDKTEAAYARGDLFDKRRRLMENWATFCATPQRTGNVRTLREVGAQA